jgi:hypothetical protein
MAESVDSNTQKAVKKMINAFKKPINFAKLGSSILKNKDKIKGGKMSIDVILDILVDAQ